MCIFDSLFGNKGSSSEIYVQSQIIEEPKRKSKCPPGKKFEEPPEDVKKISNTDLNNQPIKVYKR